MDRNIIKLKVEDGAITNIPIFRRKGNNWVATIWREDKKLGRAFWRSENYLPIVPNDLKVNTPIEVAADEQAASKWKDRWRQYYVITAIGQHELTAEEYKTGSTACSAAQKYREGVVSHPSLDLSTVHQLVIAAGICEYGWQLSTGKIVEQPYKVIDVSGTTWVLESAVPGFWTYIKEQS